MDGKEIHAETDPYRGKDDATSRSIMPVETDRIVSPKEWPMPRKLFHTVLPCLVAFEITFSTSITVPAAGLIASRFSVSRTASLLPLTLYTLGLAFGPLVFAPFSEVVGRRPIYIGTFSSLLLFTGLGTVAPSFASLLVFRFLAGFLGSAAMAIGAGTVADIWDLKTSGGTVSLFFILGPFLGPIFGPVAGSYILADHDQDWRWTQWLILMIGAPIMLCLVFTKETSTHHLSNSSRPSLQGVSLIADKIKTSILRSIRMLFGDIVVLSLSIYTAYGYALTFSYFASIPYVMPRYYGLDTKSTSLIYLSILIGYLLAVALFAYFDKTLYARARLAANGESPAPEHRLYCALVGSVFLPVGLFWFAWAPRPDGHWAVVAASGIPFGLGSYSLFISSINYLVDVYQAKGAASALAANGCLRFTLGAVFPLFTLPMYEGLGIHWAGSVFGFLSVALLPIPWLLLRYGHRLREKGVGRP